MHISFVRSVDLDEWTPQQLLTMKLGGNLNAAQFFRKYGVADGFKTEQKYTSRAAEMYKAHLSSLVANKMLSESQLEPESPCEAAAPAHGCGLDNLLMSYQPKEAGSSTIAREEAGASPSPEPEAVAVAVAGAPAPVVVVAAPPAPPVLVMEDRKPASKQSTTPREAGGLSTSNSLAVGMGELKLTTGTSSSSEAETPAPGAAAPTLMFKNPPRKTTAAKSMGARKLGARKMGDPASTGGGASMGTFEETEQQAKDAEAAAQQAAKVETDRKANDLNQFMGSTPRSGGRQDWAAPLPPSPVIHESLYKPSHGSASTEAGPIVSTGPLAARFSTAKGIGSDQLFGNDDETPDMRYERQTKLAAMSGNRAISSDMYFGNGEDPSQYGSSPYNVDSPDLNAVAEQAAERLRNVGQGVARGVGLLKDASSTFFDSLRG